MIRFAMDGLLPESVHIVLTNTFDVQVGNFFIHYDPVERCNQVYNIFQSEQVLITIDVFRTPGC